LVNDVCIATMRIPFTDNGQSSDNDIGNGLGLEGSDRWEGVNPSPTTEFVGAGFIPALVFRILRED